MKKSSVRRLAPWWSWRRRSATLVAASVLAIPLIGLAPGAARADASFDTLAAAQNLHVTISNDKGSIPLTPTVDFGLGTAQISLDSNASSKAYASSPDPGFVGTLPGLIGAFTPPQLPTSPSLTYPATAQVTNGQEPSDVGGPGFQLHAEAQDESVLATTMLGGSADGSTGAGTSTARAFARYAPGGTVTSTAVSDTSLLAVKGLITFAQVHAEATVIRDPSGSIRRITDLAVGRISVAGASFGFADGALTAGGSAMPIDTSVVNALLQTASQGQFSVRFTQARSTKNGVVAPSIELTQKTPAPPDCVSVVPPDPVAVPILGGVKYCGLTTVIYTVGGASAGTDYAVIRNDTAQPLPPVDGGGSSAAAGRAGEGGPVTAGIPALGAGAQDVPPVLADPNAGGTGEKPGPVTALRNTEAVVGDTRTTADIYLAVMAAGILALGASSAIRILGVRNRWLT